MNRETDWIAAAQYRWLDRFSPLGVALLSFVLTGIVPVGVALATGKAFFSDAHPDYPYFGKFLVWPVAFCAIFPLANGVFAAFHHHVRQALSTTLASGVFTLDPRGRDALERGLLAMRSPKKLAACALVALAVTAYFWLGPSKMMEYETWCRGSLFGRFSLLFFFILPAFFVEVAVIANAIVDFGLWIRCQSILTGGDGVRFRPLPLHPDRAAGLALFGATALRIYYFVFLLVGFVVAQTIEKFVDSPHLDMFGIIAKYETMPLTLFATMLLLPFSFFLPLVPFTAALRQRREEYFAALNPRIRQTEEWRQTVAESDPDTTDQQLTELERLDKLYDLGRRIPAWPFDMQTLRSFAISVVLPSAALLLEFLLG